MKRFTVLFGHCSSTWTGTHMAARTAAPFVIKAAGSGGGVQPHHKSFPWEPRGSPSERRAAPASTTERGPQVPTGTDSRVGAGVGERGQQGALISCSRLRTPVPRGAAPAKAVIAQTPGRG